LTGYKVCIIEIEDKFDVSDVKDKWLLLNIYLSF
jgi:hypothetical protein